MLANQNITFFLFFIPVYQLLFFTIQLFTLKKAANRARWFFGLLLLSLTLFLIINALFYLNYPKELRWSYYLFVPLFLVFIPLFYKYLLSVTETKNTDLTGNDKILFLPSVVVLALNIFTFVNVPSAEKLTLLIEGNSVNGQVSDLFIYTGTFLRYGLIFLLISQITFYTFKIVSLLRSHKRIMEKDASHLPGVNIRWLSYIFINLILFMFISLVFNLAPAYYKGEVLWGFSILIIVSGALIGYLGLKQENLHEYIARLSYINGKEIDNSSKPANNRSAKLTQEEKSNILLALKKLMETKKLYLNSKLSINELSEHLNVSKRSISIVVNEELGTNIYGFINDYRISEAKNIIADSGMEYLSIEGISRQVGFTSKSSFYSSFKRSTGKTPLQFRKER